MGDTMQFGVIKERGYRASEIGGSDFAGDE
jgi:hypothetical protein